MKDINRILVVEDLINDYELAQLEIRESVQHCVFERVENRTEFLQELEEFQPDVIVCDYQLPAFTGLDALELTQKHSPSTPLIIWTGYTSEEIAVDCMKKGASNYIDKANRKRLGPAVVHAMEERRLWVERDHAQAESRAREQELRTITEDMTELICRFKPDGVLTYVNNVYCDYFGKSREELIGTSFIPLGIADFPQKHSGYLNSFSSQQPIKTFEQYDFGPDGRKRWREWIDRAIFNESGELVEFQSTGRDITRRKEAEEKYQIIFENSPVGVFQSTPDGKYLSANPALAHIYGFASPQEMFAQVHDIATQVYLNANDREQFLKPLNESGVLNDFEMMNRKKDGSIFWTSTSARVVRDETGNILYYEGFLQDITQRKKAEEALKSNEKRFRSLIENGLDDISLLDVDGKLLWESPATVRNLGYSPDQFLGQNMFDIMHPDDLAWATELFRELVQKPGSRQHQSFRLKRSDGTWRWVEAITTNMLNEPAVQAIVVNYRDITLRKQAEQALREGEENYRLLFESNPMPMWIYDLETLKFLRVNDAAVEHYGYSAEDFLRMTIKDIRPPEDTPRLLKNIARTGINTSQGVDRSGIWRHCKKDGTVILVDIISHSVTFEGRKAEVVLANDVTVSKRAELEIQQRNDDLELINALNNVINRGESLDAVMKLLWDETKRLFSSEYTTMYLLNPDGQSLKMQQFFLRTGITKKIEKIIGRPIPSIEIPLQKDGLFEIVKNGGRGIVTSDPEMIKGWIGEFVETSFLAPAARGAIRRLIPHIFKILEINSTILVPLISDGKTIGFLNVSSSLLLTEQDLKRIENISGQLTAAIRRKQVEDALNAERNLLRTLIDNLPDRIYVMDHEGRKTISNTADWKASGGKTMEDVIGKTDFDTYPPELAEQFWELDKAVLDSGKPVINYEEPGLDFDGNPVSILTTKIPLRNEEGKVIGLVGVGRDITERKKAEQSLLESQAKYQNLVETSHDLIWAVDKDGRFTFLNRAAKHIYGYEPEELIGRPFFDILDPDHYKPNPETLKEAIATASEFQSVESYVRHRDGRQLILSANSIVTRDDDGNLIGITGSSRDITEGKQVELERQVLLEIMQGLANTDDLQEFLTLIHRAIARVIYAENCFVVLHQPDSGLFEEIYSVDQFDPPSPPASLEKSITSYVFRSGQPLLITRERFSELLMQGEVELVGTNSESWLGVPLKTTSGTIGVIAVQDYVSPNRYSERDKDFLASIASQVALAIERKRTEEAEREQRALAEALLETAETLNSTLDYREVLDRILDAVGRVVPHNAGTIMIVESGFAHVVRSHGYGQHGFEDEVMGVKLALAETDNLRHIIETGQTIIINDTHAYPGWKRMLVTDWLRANIGAPISLYGEVIGFILLDSETVGFFTPVHAKRLEAFASQAAIAIHNSRLLQQAQDEIAERKQAEENLRTSNERFDLISRAVNDAIWDWDLRTNQVNWSGAIHELFNYRPDEVDPYVDWWIENLHPDDREDIMNSIQSAIDSETTNNWMAEYRYRKADGSYAFVLDRGYIIRDGSNKANRIVGAMQDITERKQAEDLVRESGVRLAEAQIMAKVGSWETDLTTLKVMWSDETYRIFELDKNTFHASHSAFLDFVHPEDRKKVDEAFVASLERDSDNTIEHRVITAQGKVKFVEERWQVVHDTQGRPLRAVGTCQDITERKRAEQALRDSEAIYRQAIEVAGSVPYYQSYDSDNDRLVNYEFIGEGIRQITGYGPEEFNAALWDSLTEEINLVEDLAGYSLEEGIQRVRSGENPIWKCEHRIRDRAGKIHWVFEAAVELRDENGISRGSIGTYQDITARKQAEESVRAERERAQNYLDIAGVMLLALDQNGTIILINQKGCEVLGFSYEEIIGRDWIDTFLPETIREELHKAFHQLISGEVENAAYYENIVLTKYGEERLIAWHNTLLRDAQGMITSTLSSGEDITERRWAENELRASEDRFRQLASNIEEVFWMTDAETGREIYISPAGEKIWGHSLDHMMHEPNSFINFVFAEDKPAVLDALEREKAGEKVEVEYRVLHPDGSLHWIWDRAFPIFGEDGRVKTLAGIAADITERKRSENDINRHLTELKALYENGLVVGQLLQPAAIGNRVLETFARHLSWHHVAIRLLRSGTDELEVIAFNQPGLSDEEKFHMERHFNQMISKTGQGLSGWAVQTGVPFRTGNVHSHPQYVDTQAGIESGLYMPLKIGDRIIGVISVESDLPNAFTEQDERLLATLASQAAVAFENARLYQEIQLELAERKKAEDALRTSETHYRDLADSITDILFEMDHDLRYIHWNKASEIFSSVPAQDAIGKTIRELFSNSETSLGREEIYRSVLIEQKAKMFQAEIVPRNQNQKRILEINAYPSARGVSVVAKDVTERKRNETLLERRFELMEYSGHHDLSEIMQKTVDIISELTGSHIGFYFFVDQDEKTLNMQVCSTETVLALNGAQSEGMHLALDQAGVWAEAAHQRRSVIHNDYKSLPQKKGLPDGHIPISRELAVPVIRNEKLVALIGVGNKESDYAREDIEIVERFADYAWDITERKQMENQLMEERVQLARRVDERTADLSRANSNLARALRVKDEFLANMSHELRTPLNAILGLSESLGEQVAGPLNEKQQKYLTTINESGHHLLSLINDILDLAKIEAGQITLDINKVDVNSVCQASLRMVKQLAQKKNQDISFEIDDDIGLMWADERRLKQMLVNLLSNAVKFTPEAGRLGLEVHGDRTGNKVILTVWDNGIGISPDGMEKLFRPFVQLATGLAREVTGTGLGLTLVAQMARLHGGSVTVQSQPEEGSRFSIQLPWEPALASDAAMRLRNTGKFPAIKPDAKEKPTILLIEDTKEVVMMITDYLEMAGYKIITAQDGVDGITQAKLGHPNLILMDIQMPRMDGFETTQKLRADPQFKDTPIIALTALAMSNDRQRCLEAGMNEYISKPVNLKALAKIIRQFLFESKESKSP